MKFKEKFEKRVKDTIKRYNLLKKDDRVLVAISGGKDSTSCLYLLNKFGYQTEGLHIDLEMGDWSNKNIENVRELCKKYNIRLHIVSMREIYGSSVCYIKEKIGEEISRCMICGVMKKWVLNRFARKIKADKIATGHNLDDEAQTVLMNYFKGNLMLGVNSGPITGTIEDKKFVPRIKPLYFSPEKENYRYAKIMKFPVLFQRCPCAVGTYRVETRAFLDKLGDKAKKNIVENFLRKLPELRERVPKTELKYCKYCGEPARNEVCKNCSFVLKIRSSCS